LSDEVLAWSSIWSEVQRANDLHMVQLMPLLLPSSLALLKY